VQGQLQHSEITASGAAAEVTFTGAAAGVTFTGPTAQLYSDSRYRRILEP